MRNGNSVQKKAGMDIFRIISRMGDFYGSIATQAFPVLSYASVDFHKNRKFKLP